MRPLLLAILFAACQAPTPPPPSGGNNGGDTGGEEQPPPQHPAIWGHAQLEDTNPDPRIVEVSLTAGVTRVALDETLSLDMWAYNGQVPGPVLVANVGDEIIVHFKNDLAEPTTVHWHGMRIPADMDGSPLIQNPVPAGGEFTYHFVAPEAGSFWYHPHVRAFEQIERGLYGAIVIHGERDPFYDADRYLMLDDVLLDDAGGFESFTPDYYAMHGRSGNVLLTNGRAAEATARVTQGQVERWRIVNTSNARTMEVSVSGARWKVIGTDGGLLRTPYAAGRIEVAIGQRYDLEVTFDQAGTAELLSHVLTLDDSGEVVEIALPVFAAQVAPGVEPRIVPWPEFPAPAPREVDQEVTIRIDAIETYDGQLMWRINGQMHMEGGPAMDPLFTFKRGATVRMKIHNEAMPEHPFHLHGQFFEIVQPAQPGLKDTVLLPGGSLTEIVAYFDNPGRWMAHCHILEHAALGMMSEIMVEE